MIVKDAKVLRGSLQ